LARGGAGGGSTIAENEEETEHDTEKRDHRGRKCNAFYTT